MGLNYVYQIIFIDHNASTSLFVRIVTAPSKMFAKATNPVVAPLEPLDIKIREN